MIKGLSDIAPQGEDVTVGTGTVTVRGISLRAIASLISRFPSLAQLLSGGSATVDDLMGAAPDAASAIMAAAAGYLGQPEAEAVFDALPIEAQLDLLERVVRLTFPGGFGPFADRLSQLASSVSTKSVEAESSEATASPPLSSG